METGSRQALEQFVRDHHVHYDVETREASAAGSAHVVGFDLRLLATHGESKLEAPACPRCVELLRELRSFAERLASDAGTSSWAEIIPEPAVLYQSSEVRGADEVALTLRVLRDADARGAPLDDPRLAAIRQRLESLGVPRRP